MSIIIRLQHLPWEASAAQVREFFSGLTIPPGGVHILGGDTGDTFVAFATDDDAMHAMRREGKILGAQVKLMLSSKREMQQMIDNFKQKSKDKMVPAPPKPSPRAQEKSQSTSRQRRSSPHTSRSKETAGSGTNSSRGRRSSPVRKEAIRQTDRLPRGGGGGPNSSHGGAPATMHSSGMRQGAPGGGRLAVAPPPGVPSYPPEPAGAFHLQENFRAQQSGIATDARRQEMFEPVSPVHSTNHQYQGQHGMSMNVSEHAPNQYVAQSLTVLDVQSETQGGKQNWNAREPRRQRSISPRNDASARGSFRESRADKTPKTGQPMRRSRSPRRRTLDQPNGNRISSTDGRAERVERSAPKNSSHHANGATRYLEVKGLPAKVHVRDLRNYFHGCVITHNGIKLTHIDQKRNRSVAFIEFESSEDCTKAMQVHHLFKKDYRLHTVRVAKDIYMTARDELSSANKSSAAAAPAASSNRPMERGRDVQRSYESSPPQYATPAHHNYPPANDSPPNRYGFPGGEVRSQEPTRGRAAFDSPRIDAGYRGEAPRDDVSRTYMPSPVRAYEPPSQTYGVPQEPTQVCIKIDGLPHNITNNEILQIFSGLRITNIIIMQHNKGRAFVEFASPYDCQTALRKSGTYLDKHYIITIQAVGREQMLHELDRDNQALISATSAVVSSNMPLTHQQQQQQQQQHHMPGAPLGGFGQPHHYPVAIAQAPAGHLAYPAAPGPSMHHQQQYRRY